MDSLAQLEVCTSELAAAVRSLSAQQHENTKASVDFDGARVPRSLISTDASPETHKLKGTILASVARIQKLLDGPTEFLQHLAVQVYLIS